MNCCENVIIFWIFCSDSSIIDMLIKVIIVFLRVNILLFLNMVVCSRKVKVVSVVSVKVVIMGV